eukprot:1531798-Lingulodinium_polyedra.AAC.1
MDPCRTRHVVDMRRNPSPAYRGAVGEVVMHGDVTDHACPSRVQRGVDERDRSEESHWVPRTNLGEGKR